MMFEITVLDHAHVLSWVPLLQGMLMLAIGFGVGGAITASIRELAGGYWILGWAAMLISGALYLTSEHYLPIAIYPGFAADALFAPLMFMGALDYARRPARVWPLVIGVLGGVVRGLLYAIEAHDLLALQSSLMAPSFLLASAIVVGRASKTAPLRLPIAAMLTLCVGMELWDAWYDFEIRANAVPWTAVVAICAPLGGLQIGSRLIAMHDSAVSASNARELAARQRDSERERYRTVIENAPDLVAEIGPDLRITYVNECGRNIVGLDLSQLIGRRALEFAPPELQIADEDVWPALVKGGTTPITAPIQDVTGARVYLELSAAEYDYSDGPRLVIFGRDVTDRHRHEADLARYRAELEDRVEERSERLRESLSQLREKERLATVGTLAAGIAHQINNPIGAITAAVEFALLVDDDPNIETIRRDALASVLEESRRVGRIVKSVLQLARNEKTSKWPEDLSQLVRRASEITRPYVEELGGTLVVAVSNDPLPVVVSPIEIEQIVVNLIRNAAESRSGGANVRVRTRRTRDMAEIEVEDDGVGIDHERLSHVFDPFFTTRLRSGGTGLGLSVAHGIVKNHRGQIDVKSEVGRGTCVVVQLPQDTELKHTQSSTHA